MTVFKNRTELIGVLICLAAAAIFGLYPPAARGVYQDGGNITFVVLTATFFRLLGLYGLALFRGQKPFPSFSESKTSLYAGVFQAISVVGILGGSFFMPGAVVIIIIYTYSLMLLFFSAWRRQMKLNPANALSTLTALIGLGLVLNIGEHGLAFPVQGVALAFMAALATFACSYIFGQQSKSRHPLVIGSETFTVAFLVLLLLPFWELPALPETGFGYIMMAMAALSLTIGSFGMFYGIAYLGSYRFSMIMKLEPVFTTLFGILLVGDFLEPAQYAGIALVILSLVSLQIFDKQK